jgi:hypothetical protein
MPTKKGLISGNFDTSNSSCRWSNGGGGGPKVVVENVIFTIKIYILPLVIENSTGTADTTV